MHQLPGGNVLERDQLLGVVVNPANNISDVVDCLRHLLQRTLLKLGGAGMLGVCAGYVPGVDGPGHVCRLRAGPVPGKHRGVSL